MQLGVLMGALSSPGVRAEAIQTLASMGRVTGPREARLQNELARLRTRGWGFIQVPALPKLYGRDPRVLEFLMEWMRNGNQWQRALAATELCGLGETATAFRAASDPQPRVRQSLAAAIGYFNELSGAEVLTGLLQDGDPAVSEAARRALEMLRNPGRESEPAWDKHDDSGWNALLEELSELRLTDPQLRAKIASAGRTRLSEAGATLSQIASLEQKIGRPLPPSYRSFLAKSNGFLAPDIFIPELLGAEAVDWFKVRHADWAVAYRDTYPQLGSCLQVSAPGDGAVILLDPVGKSGQEEWQAYFFANWIPGARIHLSFGAFMRNEIEQCCLWRNR